MVLTIAIENTIISVGCFKETTLQFVENISTNRARTELEYMMCFQSMFDMHGVKCSKIEGTIISSVVPQVTNIVKNATKRMTEKEALVIGPGVKTGLNIMTDQPAQLGSDLVANAVSGIKQYEAPMVIVNMGTATTLSVINEKKQYIGGMILPGVQMSADSLAKGTAQLPGVSLDKPKKVIGANTTDCMKSGLIYGMASSVDGSISHIEKELGKPVKTIVATGAYAKHILPYCEKEVQYNENLLLEGLRFIYEKNA